MHYKRTERNKVNTIASILLLFLTASSTITSVGVAVASASANDSTLPLFKMTLLVPIGDPVKVAWAQLLCTNLEQLGIDCQIALASENDIYSRAITPNSSVIGKDYDQGGFDALILGYQMPLSPDPYLFYNSSQFPPAGRNYYLWNDSYNDELCSEIRTETNLTERLALEKTWQSYAMQQVPSTAVFYSNGTMLVNTNLDLTPFTSLYYPIWPAVERWSGNLTALDNNVTVAQLQNATNLMPIFSTSYFDDAVMNPVYGPAGYGLFQLNNMEPSRSYVPCMASQMANSSTDGRNWTVYVRNGVQFQDGENLTAYDVNFTLHAYMTPEVGSPLYPLFVNVFGSNDSIEVTNSTTIQIHLPRPYAYIMDLLSVPILPEHILANIPYDQWKTSPFNTGVPSSPATYYTLTNGTPVELTGPVGAGPYSYVGYDSATQTYHLQKFDGYFNTTALEAAGLFQIPDYYVKVVGSGQSAIQDFLSGQVSIVDSQYHLELYSSLSSLVTPNEIVTFDSLEVQELGFNMQNPILGTGLGTPLGMSNPSEAANASRDVREAISYAIPRPEIVEQLLNGYGVPGKTSVFCPLSEGYDPTPPPYGYYNMTQAALDLELAGYQPSSLVPSFWDAYGTFVIIIVVAVVLVITVLILRKTGWMSRLRKQGAPEKSLK
jgi:ABC-type transport system substrate-binding protein